MKRAPRNKPSPVVTAYTSAATFVTDEDLSKKELRNRLRQYREWASELSTKNARLQIRLDSFFHRLVDKLNPFWK